MILKRLDLSKKDVVTSSYFYLQPNDVVYVEPDKAKGIQASTNPRFWAIATSILTVIVLLVSRI